MCRQRLENAARVFANRYLATLKAYDAAKNAAMLPLEGAYFVAHCNHGREIDCRVSRSYDIVDKHLNMSALKKSGVSCHALRHTFGTLAVAGGAKIEHLRDAMGHSNIETTAIYVRAVERSKNNPSNFIDVEI
jgi:site-specific recombinase XerD